MLLQNYVQKRNTNDPHHTVEYEEILPSLGLFKLKSRLLKLIYYV